MSFMFFFFDFLHPLFKGFAYRLTVSFINYNKQCFFATKENERDMASEYYQKQNSQYISFPMAMTFQKSDRVFIVYIV